MPIRDKCRIVSQGNVVKTWSFLADLEGFIALPLTGGISAQQLGADGEPPGCLQFLAGVIAVPQTVLQMRSGPIPSTATTWRTWGVPANASVTSVRLKSYKRRLFSNVGYMDPQVGFQLFGGVNNVYAYDTAGGVGPDLTYLQYDDKPAILDPAFVTVTDNNPTLNILPVNAPSASPIVMKVWWSLDAGTSMDFRLDEISLQINYARLG